MLRTAGTYNGSGSILTPSEWGGSIATDEEPGGCIETLPFDRRREPRARSSGWAQILCSTPYRTFLGGAKELRDVSQSGIGLISDCAMPEGEVVEVRLAPFKVRGKMGVIVRCDRDDELAQPGLDGPKPRYRVAVDFRSGRFAA